MPFTCPWKEKGCGLPTHFQMEHRACYVPQGAGRFKVDSRCYQKPHKLLGWLVPYFLSFAKFLTANINTSLGARLPEFKILPLSPQSSGLWWLQGQNELQPASTEQMPGIGGKPAIVQSDSTVSQRSNYSQGFHMSLNRISDVPISGA